MILLRTMLVLAILYSGSIYSQKTESKSFKVDALWKFQLLYPVPFGENSLAKAHDNKIGFGIELGLFKYDKFRLGGGFNFLQYKVSDVGMIGNIQYSNYTSWYGSLSYELAIVKRLSLFSDIGYGHVRLHQKTESRSFGHQDGNEYRIGMSGNYNFSEKSSIFIGVHYITTDLEIKTHPQYEDFFGKINQLQFAVGVQFD